MYKILNGLFFFFSLVSNQLNAQILPIEGSELNYRLIGFSSPKGQPGCKYVIEIAAGNYINEDSFKQNIIKSFPGDKNRIIGEVPSFGKQYTWRSIITGKDSKITTSNLHHFSTLIIPEVDTSVTRLRITHNAEKYKDDYVFIDGARALYDMNGQPVWFLPQKDTTSKVVGEMLKRLLWGGITFVDNETRDLKLSPWGTITFMESKLYETNYNGNILWKVPESKIKDSLKAVIDNYHHHEFTRLNNGHYMTMGINVMTLELPPSVTKVHIGPHSEIIKDNTTNKLYQQIVTGRIIEFDKKGNVVWSWNSADYFKHSDLMERKRPNGAFQLTNTHENAFYFDEKEKAIYISFKNINRIIKIQYPTGKILNVYGVLYTPGDLELNNDLFCGEHSVKRSMDGYIYMYNNNTCNYPCDLPTIIMIQAPDSGNAPMKKIWEYECTIDSSSFSEQEQQKLHFGLGGNVFELPDRSMFCCMGYNYSKTFIVSRDKKILWSAIPEAWDNKGKKWIVLSSYRASIISRKELESLIWNEPLKNK